MYTEDKQAASAPRSPFSRGPSSRCHNHGASVGFGVTFVALGATQLLRAAGLEVPLDLTYPAVLMGLGAAGIWSILARRRESR